MRPVFIHISKNGGTSVTRAAGGSIVSAGHRTAASWLAEHGRTGPMFAIVRHPYDRVASEYAYRRRRLESGEINPHLTGVETSFDRWVMSTFLGGEFRTQEFFDRTGVPYRPMNMVGDSLIWFASQVRWLCDPERQLLVDDVLRFETLEVDWARFSASRGLAGSLGHDNASPGSSELRSTLGRRIKGVIHEYYRDDFEVFGYEP